MTVPAVRACPLTLIAWRLSAVPLLDLWWHYVDLGGTFTQPALAAYLARTTKWPAAEHNLLAHALNEYLWDSGSASLAPYRPPEDVEDAAAASWADPPDQREEPR